jgi:hypothetical protein
VDRGGNTTSFTRWVEGIRESQEGCGDRTSTVRSEHLSDGAAFPLRSGSVAHPRGWVDREGHGREGSGEGRATVRSAPFADRSLPDGASEPTRRPVRIHGENRLVSSRRPSGRGRSRGYGKPGATARKHRGERRPRHRTPTPGHRRRRAGVRGWTPRVPQPAARSARGLWEPGTADGRSLRTAESKEAGVQTPDSEHEGRLASRFSRMPRGRLGSCGSRRAVGGETHRKGTGDDGRRARAAVTRYGCGRGEFFEGCERASRGSRIRSVRVKSGWRGAL